jgi:hypothetical protein
LLPWTIRTPRFTFVSDGNPLRRLLIVSKKPFWFLLAHDPPPSCKMAGRQPIGDTDGAMRFGEKMPDHQEHARRGFFAARFFPIRFPDFFPLPRPIQKNAKFVVLKHKPTWAVG